MNLNVPLLKQEEKGCCGPASLRMLLGYCGDVVTEKIIRKSIWMMSKTRGGTTTTELAKFVLRWFGKKYSVWCYSYKLTLFQPSDVEFNSEQLLLKLYRMRLGAPKNEMEKVGMNGIIYLLENGADFRFKMPSLSDVRKFLDKKQPVVLAVNLKILNEADHLEVDSGHFIVITGYAKDFFFYNDSGRSRGRERITSEKLFFALSNNVLDSSAYLLTIKKNLDTWKPDFKK